MNEIKPIRPAYPITPVKRTDPEEDKRDRPPAHRAKQPKPKVKNDDDPESHKIDEYV